MPRLHLLLPRLLAVLSLASLPLRAAPNPADYPLHLKVLYNSSARPAPGARFNPNLASSSGSFSGQGQGDLITPNGAQAVDYTYAECATRVTMGRSPIVARWKKQNKQLEVLLPRVEGMPPKVDESHLEKCTLDVTTHDYVFVPGGDPLHPATMSLQDYLQPQHASLRSLIEGIRAPFDNATNTVASTGVQLTAAEIAQHSDLGTIVVTPIPNAPFTATVASEIMPFAPGVTMRLLNPVPSSPPIFDIFPSQPLKSHRLIARDSPGRIFEEHRVFTPSDDPEAPLVGLRYLDPVQHLAYICDADTKTCRTIRYDIPAQVRLNSPSANAQVKDLGIQTIEHFSTFGTLQTTLRVRAPAPRQPGFPLSPCGTADICTNLGSSPELSRAYNDWLQSPQANGSGTMRAEEFWFSPQLQINLVERRSGIPFGNIIATVNNVDPGAPDPKLFQPPADYKILPIAQNPQQAASAPAP